MAKRIRFCPRCMNIIHRGENSCSSCGLSLEKMIEMQQQQEQEKEEIIKQNLQTEKAEFEEYESNLENPNQQVENTEKVENEQTANKPKRHKHKPKPQRKEDIPEYVVDENGEFEIDTKDVTYLEGIDKQTYSVKKARGDTPAREKLKWWEIYKWADLMLARRKINKEVKKASYKQPYGISKTKTMLLAIFFGWMGAHNFYVGNYKRGWTMLAIDLILPFIIYIPALYAFMGVFVGGGLGFVLMVMWLADLIGLVTNHFKYRISKEEFISNLNIETRGKLAKKYWNLDRAVFKQKEQARIDKILKRKNKKLSKKK